MKLLFYFCNPSQRFSSLLSNGFPLEYNIPIGVSPNVYIAIVRDTFYDITSSSAVDKYDLFSPPPPLISCASASLTHRTIGAVKRHGSCITRLARSLTNIYRFRWFFFGRARLWWATRLLV